MRTRLIAVLTVTVVACVLAVPSAVQASVEDILGCDPQANSPRRSGGSIIGNGRASGPRCSTAVATVEVCLDWNGVTELGSCRTYGSSTGGDSNAVACKPGLWESQVTVTYKDGSFEAEHSIQNQAALVVTDVCR